MICLSLSTMMFMNGVCADGHEERMAPYYAELEEWWLFEGYNVRLLLCNIVVINHLNSLLQNRLLEVDVFYFWTRKSRPPPNQGFLGSAFVNPKKLKNKKTQDGQPSGPDEPT